MAGFYQAYAGVDRRIAQSGADYAIIDRDASPFSVDLVFNLPDLSNRPLRFVSEALGEREIGKLCAPGKKVLLVAREDLAPINDLFRLDALDQRGRIFEEAAASMKAGPCELVQFP